jgi:mannitol operon transcriptional antiterminator
VVVYLSLDQRSSAILSYLTQTREYVPVKVLSEKFNISRRTIYYDIEKINGWLKEHKLSNVQYVRSAGFFLEEETATQIPEKLGLLKVWHYEYTPKERKAWLSIYLMSRTSPLYLEDLMQKVRVSRNTVIDDLKGLKEELSRFDLELVFERKVGYVISGKEDDKRKAIVFYLQHVFTEQSWQPVLARIPVILNSNDESLELFDLEKMKVIQHIVSSSEQELNIQFTDEFLHNLVFRLLLFVRRMSQGKKIMVDSVEKKILRETKEYKAAIKISEQLSTLFRLDFPEDEIFYITKHLLGSRIQFSEDLVLNRSNQETEVLAGVVSNMVTDFQTYACVFFENRDEIEKNLLLHVKPAFYRIKYGLEIESDVSESIKEKYSDVFRLTKKVIVHLKEAAGKEVSDHEIALIAMHFGGWMERIGAKPANRKNALLVCTTGVGTSQLLWHQLEGLFSTVDILGCVSKRDYEKNIYDVDFIISTIQLEEKNKPVFVVSPILTEAEKEGLLQKVNALVDAKPQQRTSIEAVMSIVQKYAKVMDEESLQRELKKYLYQPANTSKEMPKPDLKDLLKVENIQVAESAPDWKEAIRLAAKPLLNDGAITNVYIRAMIDTLVKMGPYIVVSPKVAIPHARPEDGVNRLGMSLLRLEKSVPFSDQETHDVQLIIVLAAIDGEAHLKALSQLTNMLSDKDTKEKLIAGDQKERIFELIKAYSV